MLSVRFRAHPTCRTGLSVIALSVALALAGFGSAASAADYRLEYFKIGRLKGGADPTGLTQARDGRIWFVQGNGRVGWIDAAGLVHRVQPVEGQRGAGKNAITTGPDGNPWFAAGKSVGRVAADGTVSLFNVDSELRIPGELTVGPDRRLWIGDPIGRKRIGRLDPVTGEAVSFESAPGSPGSVQVLGITNGPDGNVWFTAHPSGIGRVFGPTAAPIPGYTEYSYDFIGRITPTGAVTQFRLPGQFATYPDQATAEKVRDAVGIATGPDGNLWFTRPPEGVGRLTPTGEFSEYPVPADGAGRSIVRGPDGNLWFPGAGATIKSITPTGSIASVALPGGRRPASDLLFDRDGSLWFTSYDDSGPIGLGIVGRITFGTTAAKRPLSGLTAELGPAGRARLRVAVGLARPAVMVVSVRRVGQSRVLASRQFSARAGRTLRVIVTKQNGRTWEPGRYEVTAAAQIDGRRANSLRARFSIPAP